MYFPFGNTVIEIRSGLWENLKKKKLLHFKIADSKKIKKINKIAESIAREDLSFSL